MKGMRKYYIFAVVLSAAVMALVAAILIGDSPRRHDRLVYKSVYNVVQEVQSYVGADKNRGVPADLNTVYTKNAPKNIIYNRVDNKVFMVCATFKQDHDANSTYDTYGYDTTGQYGSAKSYMDQKKKVDPQTAYWFVGPYMSDYGAHYKMGKNCFVAQAIDDAPTYNSESSFNSSDARVIVD